MIVLWKKRGIQRAIDIPRPDTTEQREHNNYVYPKGWILIENKIIILQYFTQLKWYTLR